MFIGKAESVSAFCYSLELYIRVDAKRLCLIKFVRPELFYTLSIDGGHARPESGRAPDCQILACEPTVFTIVHQRFYF